MRFQEAYDGWREGRLTQAEAALSLGQCERSFLPHFQRYEADGLEGLVDRRLSQISMRRAREQRSTTWCNSTKAASPAGASPTFTASTKLESKVHSYSWIKIVLQGAYVIQSRKRRGKHRNKSERMPLASMVIYQDPSTHR